MAGPLQGLRGGLPPCPLLLPPAIRPCGVVGGGVGGSKSLESPHLRYQARQTPPPSNVLSLNPTVAPLDKLTPKCRTPPPEVTQPVRDFQNSLALCELLRF